MCLNIQLECQELWKTEAVLFPRTINQVTWGTLLLTKTNKNSLFAGNIFIHTHMKKIQ